MTEGSHSGPVVQLHDGYTAYVQSFASRWGVTSVKLYGKSRGDPIQVVGLPRREGHRHGPGEAEQRDLTYLERARTGCIGAGNELGPVTIIIIQPAVRGILPHNMAHRQRRLVEVGVERWTKLGPGIRRRILPGIRPIGVN